MVIRLNAREKQNQRQKLLAVKSDRSAKTSDWCAEYHGITD